MEVFSACEFETKAAGMAGVLLTLPITGQEVLANCRLLRIPARDWPWVREGIGVLCSKIVPALNKEAADRSG